MLWFNNTVIYFPFIILLVNSNIVVKCNSDLVHINFENLTSVSSSKSSKNDNYDTPKKETSLVAKGYKSISFPLEIDGEELKYMQDSQHKKITVSKRKNDIYYNEVNSKKCHLNDSISDKLSRRRKDSNSALEKKEKHLVTVDKKSSKEIALTSFDLRYGSSTEELANAKDYPDDHHESRTEEYANKEIYADDQHNSRTEELANAENYPDDQYASSTEEFHNVENYPDDLYGSITEEFRTGENYPDDQYESSTEELTNVEDYPDDQYESVTQEHTYIEDYGFGTISNDLANADRPDYENNTVVQSPPKRCPCGTCEVCLVDRCLPYIVEDIFDKDCNLKNKCHGYDWQECLMMGGECLSAYGHFVCKCPKGWSGHRCNQIPVKNRIISDVRVVYPAIVPACTPFKILVSFYDSDPSGPRLRMKYQAADLAILIYYDKGSMKQTNPKDFCRESRIVERRLCAVLPDNVTYFVIDIDTEYPHLNRLEDLLNNKTMPAYPGQLLGYSLNFNIQFEVSTTDKESKLLLVHNTSHYQEVYYKYPLYFKDYCFPADIAVEGHCGSDYDGDDMEVVERSSPVILSVTSGNVFSRPEARCNKIYVFTVWKDDFNFDSKIMAPKFNQTGDELFIPRYQMPPLTGDHSLYRVRVSAISHSLNYERDGEKVLLSNFLNCWFSLRRQPLVARIDGGDERTVFAYDVLVLSSRSSRDPNFPPNRQQGLFFEWSCDLSDRFCASHITKAREYIVQPPLKVNVTYKFTLKVYAMYTKPEFDYQAVTVTDVKISSFIVSCLKNCGNGVDSFSNPDKTIYLAVNVTGQYIPKDTFLWTYVEIKDRFHDTNDVPRYTEKICYPLTANYVCVVLPKKLKVGTSYNFFATRRHPPFAKANIIITTGKKPNITGNLHISPASGLMISMPFVIHARESFKSLTGSIMFVFFTEDSLLHGLPLYLEFNNLGTVIDILLYYQKVTVRAIITNTGCSEMQEENVLLEPPFEEDLEKKISESRGDDIWLDRFLLYMVYFSLYKQTVNQDFDFYFDWNEILNFLSYERDDTTIAFEFINRLSCITKLIQLNDLPLPGPDLISVVNEMYKLSLTFKKSTSSNIRFDMYYTFKEIQLIAESFFFNYIQAIRAISPKNFANPELSDRCLEKLENAFGMPTQREDYEPETYPDYESEFNSETESETVLEMYNQILTNLSTDNSFSKNIYEIVSNKARQIRKNLWLALSNRMLPMEQGFYIFNNTCGFYTRVDTPDYFAQLPRIPQRTGNNINILQSYIKITPKLSFELQEKCQYLYVEVTVENMNGYWWDVILNTQLIETRFFLNSPTKQVEYLKNPLDLFLHVKFRDTVPPITMTLPEKCHRKGRKECLIVYKICPTHAKGRGRLFVEFNNINELSSAARFVMTKNIQPDTEYVKAHAVILSDDRRGFNLEYNLEDEESSFYIGITLILKHIMLHAGLRLNHTFEVYTVRCLSRTLSMWNSERCSVGLTTNKSLIHCKCFQLTQIGAAIEYPIVQLLHFDDLDFSRYISLNYIPLITIVVLGAVFVVFFILSYFHDRKNQFIDKLVVLEDNFPGEEWAYLIGVYTGAGYNCGTSSSVGVKLFGHLAETRAHILKSHLRRTFSSYSEDWFLLFNLEPLGELKKLLIWTDYSGSNPAWYCRKIVVYDWKTKIKYVFRLDCWFDLQPNNCTLHTECMAEPRYPISYGKLLLDNLVCALQLEYVVIYFLCHHPRSFQNRSQTTAVMLTTLSFVGLVLLIYYKYDNRGTEDYPVYSLRAGDLYLGMIVYILGKLLSTFLKLLFKKTIDLGHMNLWTSVNYKLQKCELKHHEAAAHEKSKTEDREKDQMRGDKKTRKTKTALGKSKVNSDFDGKAVNKLRKYSGKYLPITGAYKDAESVRVIKKRIIIVWTLSVVFILFCCLLIVEEGLTMGYNKSFMWLTVWALAILVGFLFCDLLRIVFHVIITTLCRQTEWDAIVVAFDPQLCSRLELLGDTTHLQHLLALHSRPEYQPAKRENITEVRDRQERKLFCKSLLKMSLFLFLYAVVFYSSQGMGRAVYKHNEQFLRLLMAAPVKIDRLRNLSCVISYIQDTLSTYAVNWYNGQPLTEEGEEGSSEGRWNGDYVSLIIGTMVMHQKRTFKERCVPQFLLHLVSPYCATEITPDSEDSRNFTVGWKPYIPTDAKWAKTPWTYREDPPMMITIGESGKEYTPGGYVLEMGTAEKDSKIKVGRLVNSWWIDRLTKVIFVNFRIYYTTTHRIAIISFCFEIKPTIGVYSRIQTVNIPAETSLVAMFTISWYFSLALLTLLVVQTSLSLLQLGPAYFYSLWYVIEFTIIVTFLLCFLSVTANLFEIVFSVQRLINAGDSTYYEYNYGITSDMTMLAYSILTVLNSVHLFKHCFESCQLTAVFLTARFAAAHLAGIMVGSCILLYALFFRVNGLLWNAQEQVAKRFPLVNRVGLKNLSKHHIFRDSKAVPFLYCLVCTVTIYIFSIIICYHYRRAKNSAKKIYNSLDIVRYLKEKVDKRRKMNQAPKSKRLKGGGSVENEGDRIVSQPTVEATCLSVILEICPGHPQSEDQEDECILKTMKNFVNTKIKIHKPEKSKRSDINKVCKNMESKLDKILDSLQNLNASDFI